MIYALTAPLSLHLYPTTVSNKRLTFL
jgi:hypothetical protein